MGAWANHNVLGDSKPSSFLQYFWMGTPCEDIRVMVPGLSWSISCAKEDRGMLGLALCFGENVLVEEGSGCQETNWCLWATHWWNHWLAEDNKCYGKETSFGITGRHFWGGAPYHSLTLDQFPVLCVNCSPSLWRTRVIHHLMLPLFHTCYNCSFEINRFIYFLYFQCLYQSMPTRNCAIFPNTATIYQN